MVSASPDVRPECSRGSRNGIASWVLLLSLAAQATILTRPAAAGTSGDEPVGTEIVDISTCTGRFGRAPSAFPGNPAKSVAVFDATHNYITWLSNDEPGDVLITRYDGTNCSPVVKVNVTHRLANIGASHDAPSVFVDGMGYLYVSYFGGSIYTSHSAGRPFSDPDKWTAPLIRRSKRPLDITEWEAETLGRWYNYNELNGLRLNDGAILMVGSDSGGLIEIIEPGGQYRWPSPRQVVTNDLSATHSPSGCKGNRFTKMQIFAGPGSGTDQTLYATWGWAGDPRPEISGSADCQYYVVDAHEVYFAYSTDGGLTWQNKDGTRSIAAPECPRSTLCPGKTEGILYSDPDFMLTKTRCRGHNKPVWADEQGNIYVAYAKSTWCDVGVCHEKNARLPGALMLLQFRPGEPVKESLVHTDEHYRIGGIRKHGETVTIWAETANGKLYEYASTDEGQSWQRQELHRSGRLQGVNQIPGSSSIRLAFLTTAGSNANRVHYLRKTFEELNEPNQPPVAQIAADVTSGDAPLEVALDGSLSRDPDGRLVRFLWDFGDGQTFEGETPPLHLYGVAGSYLVRLTVTDDEGATDTATRAISVNLPDMPSNRLRSLRTSIPIAIDGLLDELAWKEASSVSFTNASRSDNQITVWTLWDDQHLYFAYQVVDADLQASTGRLWQDDGAELYLDVENDKSARMDANDFQFIVNIRDQVSTSGIAAKTTLQPAGYHMELAIPWAGLDKVPSPHEVLGLLLAANDRDRGVSSQFDWLGIIASGPYARPSLWGELLLDGARVCNGDLDEDGRLGVSDLKRLVDVLVGQVAESSCADVNADGAIDVRDVQRLTELILGP